MNTYFSNYIVKIDKLFTKDIYRSQISNKADTESYMQTLIYTKKDNSETKYIINIYSEWHIEITVPIKNSNYLYITTLYNIEDVYNYLKIHI
tara:strand:+ start:125 stop:400 length:276 start_codon:yes stop_codon:yes gene_type:complete